MNEEFRPYSDIPVLINIGEINEGTLGQFAFSDPVNLGAPINDTVGLFDGIAGVEDGIKVMYTTVKGTTPVFHVMNLENQTVIRSLPMPTAGDVWSHTITPNGDVYVAAGASLWVYSPETKKISKVYTHSLESSFWALDHDEDGKVYIGTGSTGRIIQYDPVTKTGRDYGRLMGIAGQEYVRSLAYSNGFVYGGMNVANIYRIDVETGVKEEIITPADAEGYVYDLDIVDDRLLIARFDVTQVRYVYDLENEEWLDVKIDNSLTGLTTTHTSLNGKIYLPVDGYITSFDVNTYELEKIVKFGSGFRGADWIEMEDPDLPGVSLVTMAFTGGYIFFNPETGNTKSVSNYLPPNASITHVFKEGLNGKMYITGMQASKGSEYDVFTNENKLINLGQAGTVVPFEDKVFFGVYPGAVFQEYIPASGNQPTTLFNIGDEQDRPIAGVAAEGKIFIGNIPDYRILGGAMMVYDPSAENKEESYKIYRNIVQDQSIMSLTYKDGKIYGATSVKGGIGATPTATEARIFVWDIASEQKTAEFALEIPGLYTPPAIGGLTIGPDGLLWGAVNGIVFAIDTESLAVVKHKNLFPGDGPWAEWGAFKGKWHDGILYMHLGRRLAAIDPITLNHKYFETSDAFGIGEDGHLYYSPHSDRSILYKVNVQNTNHPGKLNIHAPLAVNEGDEFEVALYVNQVVNLNSIAAQLNYDAEVLSFLSAKAVGVFAEEGSAFDFVAEEGGLVVTAQLAEEQALTSDVKVAILKFKAIKDISSTAVKILQQSAVQFASSEQAYTMDVGKEITIVVNEVKQPSEPEKPSQPEQPQPEQPSATTPSVEEETSTESGTIAPVFVQDKVNYAELVKNLSARVQQFLQADESSEFKDIEQHWASDVIKVATGMKFVNGYNDDSFRPNGNITRAEFATMIVNIFGIQGSGSSATLRDVEGHWAQAAIEALTQSGIVNGYGNGTFRPDQGISREEMIIILSRIVDFNKVTKDTSKGQFSDLDAASTYATHSIQAAAQAGIINGKGNNTFDPQGQATRAEALTIIINALKLDKEIAELLASL